MSSRDFCYWLQGYFEIAGVSPLSLMQLETIRKHLALVFAHEIDPAAGGAEVQQKLNSIHAGASPAFKDAIARC